MNIKDRTERKPSNDSGVNPVGGDVARAYQYYRTYYKPLGYSWDTYLSHQIEDGRMSRQQAATFASQAPDSPNQQRVHAKRAA